MNDRLTLKEIYQHLVNKEWRRPVYVNGLQDPDSSYLYTEYISLEGGVSVIEKGRDFTMIFHPTKTALKFVAQAYGDVGVVRVEQLGMKNESKRFIADLSSGPDLDRCIKKEERILFIQQLLLPLPEWVKVPDTLSMPDEVEEEEYKEEEE